MRLFSLQKCGVGIDEQKVFFWHRLKQVVVLLFLFCLLPTCLWAQASINVEEDDRLYRDLEKLIAHGLVDQVVWGQRPFSRREVARITAEAMGNLSRLSVSLESPQVSLQQKQALEKRIFYVKGILRRLEGEFREELIQLKALSGPKAWYSLHPLEKAYVDVLGVNSLPRLVPPNGLGSADAVINPLVQYRNGRRIVDGSNLSLETTHWFRLTDYVALYARPRFQLALGRDGQADVNEAFAQYLYGKFFFKNFELQVGRDALYYGQGLRSGLLLSQNPRGLDMVKLSNDLPGFLPWVFKYLGPNKVSFFYADLGPEQNFPNDYLVGYKWSFEPLSWFEMGIGLMVQSGGKGGPPASLGSRVADIFPFSELVQDQQEIGNKIGGFDFRFRIPPWRGTEIYGEVIFDDLHRFSNADAAFVDDAGYVGGIYFPRLIEPGTVDLRLEYHRTGVRFYEHAQYTSGLTLNQFFLGDILGPNGQGAYGVATLELNEQNRLTVEGAFEARSGDVYELVNNPDGSADFIKLENKPEENRMRWVVSWDYDLESLPLKCGVGLGYERVWNFNFSPGYGRNNLLAGVQLQITLDKKTSFSALHRP